MSQIEDMINDFEKEVKKKTGYILEGIALHHPENDRIQVNWNDGPDNDRFEALNSVALMWVAMAEGNTSRLATSLEYASLSYGCAPIKIEGAKGLVQAFTEASVEVMKEIVHENVQKAQNGPQEPSTEYIEIREGDDDECA